MNLIKHKFRDHIFNIKANILIIGTFNPDVSNNEADFFYGRSRNHLWKLLPEVFNEESLKNKDKQLKLDFMNKYNIDFVDLISEINCDIGEENNYADDYIDDKVCGWKNIIKLIDNSNIKEVYFTRKTFQKIKNIKLHIEEIEKYCNKNHLRFGYLSTPARAPSEAKLKFWKNIFKKV